MIRGVHTMFYSAQPDELRAFLRDKLGFPATDIGQGWLILDLPEAEMGVHPADAGPGHANGTHDISFYTDDVRQTMAELKSKGVQFTQEIVDEGYGLVTYFLAPGGLKLQLYQPHYRVQRGKNP